MPLSFLPTNLLFTPLEQFADARWLWNLSFETLDRSTLTVLTSARELDAWSLYSTGFGLSQSFGVISAPAFDTFLFAVFVAGLCLIAAPSYAGSYASTVSAIGAYTPHTGFLLAGIHILTGGLLTF